MLNIIPKEDIIKWIKILITEYPFYGNSGIMNSQEKISKYLDKFWQRVVFDEYSFSDISNLPEILDVKEYGKPYTNYESVIKYNVYSEHDSGIPGPTIFLTGHIDVDIVDENILWLKEQGYKKPFLEKGKLYGRGSADMLSGLVCMFMVATEIIKKGLLKRGKLVFASVCDEEIGGNGTIRALDFINKNQIMDFNNENNLCIIAEPTELKICSESLGFCNFKIIFNGNSGHMGMINHLGTALSKFNDFYVNINPLISESIYNVINRDNFIYKYNIGKLNGGIDSSVPAESIEVNGTIFLQEDVDIDAFINQFKYRLAQQYGASLVKNSLSFSGADFTTKMPNFCKLEKLDLFPSPCDARLFRNTATSVIIWGPGSLNQAHSTNEYVDVEEVYLYYSRLFDFIISVVGDYDR